MRKGFISTILLLAGAVFVLASSAYLNYKSNLEFEKQKFGATILTTDLTNTIGTFRTNVNTSLQNLNDQITSTTSTDPGHTHSINTSTGTITTLTTTNITTTGINFTNATGTNLTATNLFNAVGDRYVTSSAFGASDSPSSPAPRMVIQSSTAETFSYTGTTSSLVIPPNVYQIIIEAKGGKGGDANIGGAVSGANGGSASGTISVTPGATYYYLVGGSGQAGVGTSFGVINGPVGGGGNGDNRSAAGGGMTWFGTSGVAATGTAWQKSVLLAAAGGGGAGQTVNSGAGGGLTGGDGNDNGTCLKPTGGSQSAGGAGGTASGGVAGSAGTAGQGGAGAVDASDGGPGGGGGYYGGGGGAEKNGVCVGSAAGGSSFASSTLSSTSTNSGTNNSTGSLKIFYIIEDTNTTLSGNNYGGNITFATSHATGTILFGTKFSNPIGCTFATTFNNNMWVSSSTLGTSLTTSQVTFQGATPFNTTATVYYTCL